MWISFNLSINCDNLNCKTENETAATYEDQISNPHPVSTLGQKYRKEKENDKYTPEKKFENKIMFQFSSGFAYDSVAYNPVTSKRLKDSQLGSLDFWKAWSTQILLNPGWAIDNFDNR